ncbi:MAG: hypothetical protein LUE09_06570 [Synergistaceae bacterium]|nr:hypothetical protein [Synergistaceae bacterium]
MADNRILQIIDTELVKAVTFIDFEDEKIMNEELSDSELIDVAVSRKCWSFTLGTLIEVKDAMNGNGSVVFGNLSAAPLFLSFASNAVGFVYCYNNEVKF